MTTFGSSRAARRAGKALAAKRALDNLHAFNREFDWVGKPIIRGWPIKGLVMQDRGSGQVTGYLLSCQRKGGTFAVRMPVHVGKILDGFASGAIFDALRQAVDAGPVAAKAEGEP